MSIVYPVKDVYAKESDAVLRELDSNGTAGLKADEVRQRQKKFGPNAYQAKKQKSIWSILLHQFNSLIVYLLLVGAVVSFSFGDRVEAFAILIVILINAAIGFLMEVQARTSMAALKKLDVSKSKVIRDGRQREISSEEITPGDVVFLEAGDITPADGRIIEANALQCDESALTGESMPVEKQVEALDPGASIGDQLNMMFKGTAVVNGNARIVVTGIGADTELGKITSMVEQAAETATPLDHRLRALSKRLIVITLFMTILFVGVSLIQGKEAALLVETAIALAVASIPEGLPIVATVALAYGVLLMAKRNAIVKKLSAVETLGSTNVILTDKTGTLTENKIHVDTFSFPHETVVATIENGTLKINGHGLQRSAENLRLVKKIGVLCNNATLDGSHNDRPTGDPIEVSLLILGHTDKELLGDLGQNHHRIDEIPFSSETKFMVTVHEAPGKHFVAAKGAVEQLLERCAHQQSGAEITAMDQRARSSIINRSEEMAASGLRVLAFAYREVEAHTSEFAHELIYAGMIGFLDPPRLDVRDAILSCRKAGIKVVMITGDHPKTALNIARKTGVVDEHSGQAVVGKDIPESGLDEEWKTRILNNAVFARTTPRQKLDIAGVYQEAGNVVAMTGDGINDAPALKKADVGIAMGLRGTQVAKETASIVLKDDSFTTIAEAVSHGREIFQNIRKFVVYLVSCNLSEILIVTATGIIAPASTLVPLQILFLNLVTDVFPALALGVGKGDKSIMLRPPGTSDREIVSRRNWIDIGVYAVMMTIAVVAAVLYCQKTISDDTVIVNNVAFVTLTFAQLFHIFNMASSKSNLLVNEVTRNVYVWLAIVLCAGLLLLAFVIPAVARALHLGTLAVDIWLVCVLFSFIPLLTGRLYKYVSSTWINNKHTNAN